MGCRCVIVDKDTTKENAGTKLGIYLHWYGDKETVKELLEDAKAKKPRGVIGDPCYGWARLCQIIADRITADTLAAGYETAKEHAYNTGIGIGTVNTLDCYNFDNGVYYIDDDFNIVRHTNGKELAN